MAEHTEIFSDQPASPDAPPVPLPPPRRAHEKDLEALSLRPLEGKTPAAKWILICCILVFCGLPMVYDAIVEAAQGKKLSIGLAMELLVKTGRTERFESTVEAGSQTALHCRQVDVAVFGQQAANAALAFGRDHFLFLANTRDGVIGEGFLHRATPASRTMLPVILHFREQLAKQGIHLVVMPVPTKMMIYPEKFFEIDKLPEDLQDRPAENVDRDDWIHRLRQVNIDLYDPLPVIWDFKQANPTEYLYLPTDSHWTPYCVQFVALELSKHIEKWLAPGPRQKYKAVTERTRLAGDLPRMLAVEGQTAEYPKYDVLVRKVELPPDQSMLGGPASAQVLIIGDSFSGNSPESAGLGHQLGYELGMPVQVISYPGDAIQMTRGDLFVVRRFSRPRRS